MFGLSLFRSLVHGGGCPGSGPEEHAQKILPYQKRHFHLPKYIALDCGAPYLPGLVAGDYPVLARLGRMGQVWRLKVRLVAC
jgi:hypothetical protein